MQKIDSFKIDHTTLKKGLYLSKVDGDILTLDLRIRTPYLDKTLSNVEMHSLEHLLATALRFGEFSESIIYCGPMGCATGFYVLLREVNFEKAKQIVITALKEILDFTEMPGKTKRECGNYKTLDLEKGKAVAREYLLNQ